MAYMATTSHEIEPPEEKEHFGHRFIEAVLENGGPTKQIPLSEWLKSQYKISISPAMINHYKNGKKIPRMGQCIDYAVALGVCVEWLFTGRGHKYPMNPLNREETQVIELLRSTDDDRKRQDAIGHLRVYLSDHESAPSSPVDISRSPKKPPVGAGQPKLVSGEEFGNE